MSNVKCDVHFSTRSNAKSTQLQNLVADQTYKAFTKIATQAVSHKLKFVVTSLLIQIDRHAIPVGLDVDAPLFRVESVGGERPLLAEPLEVVDVLVAAVVPLARLPFRVLGEGST